jgi:hypothetical protein
MKKDNLSPKKYSDYRLDFLKIVNKTRKEKGEPALCMMMSYALLSQGTKDLPVSVINGNPTKILAVHGMITEKGGRRVWHSWIEVNAGDRVTVFDPANDLITSKEIYYKLSKAKPEYRLTKAQYTLLVKKYKHAGEYTPAELRSR